MTGQASLIVPQTFLGDYQKNRTERKGVFVEEQKEPREPKGFKFEAEIMGRKYTSIPAMRRQLWKANKEIQKFEKEVDYREALIKKIKDFFAKSGIPVKAEKAEEDEKNPAGN